MAKLATNEDLNYEKQIEETNKYGNSLLSGLIVEKINDNKRKLAARIQINQEIKTYKKEIEKLRSLKIGIVHQILNIKEENDPTIQIEAGEKLIVKIEKILKENVCYDASGVISKAEFEELKNNIDALQYLKSTIDDVPNTAEEKLQKTNEFIKTINDTLDKIASNGATINECQNNLIKYTSEAINYM